VFNASVSCSARRSIASTDAALRINDDGGIGGSSGGDNCGGIGGTGGGIGGGNGGGGGGGGSLDFATSLSFIVSQTLEKNLLFLTAPHFLGGTKVCIILSCISLSSDIICSLHDAGNEFFARVIL